MLAGKYLSLRVLSIVSLSASVESSLIYEYCDKDVGDIQY